MVGTGVGEPRRPEVSDYMGAPHLWTAIDSPYPDGLCLVAVLAAPPGIHERLWADGITYLSDRWGRSSDRRERLRAAPSAAWRARVGELWRGPGLDGRTVAECVDAMALYLLAGQARGRPLRVPARLGWAEGR